MYCVDKNIEDTRAYNTVPARAYNTVPARAYNTVLAHNGKKVNSLETVSFDENF